MIAAAPVPLHRRFRFSPGSAAPCTKRRPRTCSGGPNLKTHRHPRACPEGPSRPSAPRNPQMGPRNKSEGDELWWVDSRALPQPRHARIPPLDFCPIVLYMYCSAVVHRESVIHSAAPGATPRAPSRDSAGAVWSALAWFGPVWYRVGQVWLGLARFGSVWLGLAPVGRLCSPAFAEIRDPCDRKTRQTLSALIALMADRRRAAAQSRP
jgi:hypothetical protein